MQERGERKGHLLGMLMNILFISLLLSTSQITEHYLLGVVGGDM